MADKSLRQKFLQFNPFQTEKISVTIPLDGGGSETLECRVKQPSVAAQSEIAMAAKAGDIARAQALAVVRCTVHADSDALVFEETDLEGLIALPAGTWMETLAAKAMTLVSQAQEAAKKSETT